MKMLMALMVAVGFSPWAWAHSSTDLEIYDRTAHRVLPIHSHGGRSYVAGEPGHRYELRIRSRSPRRVLAVVSVDGINVLSGETAAKHQSGYVIDAYDAVIVDGWRKSLDEVATFYFTALQDSYAARTHRPDNVGVIGVALFTEHGVCCTPYENGAGVLNAPASAAPQLHDKAAARAESERESLGTGHGERARSQAQYVDFQRASDTPEEMLLLYYDSRSNLIARGVLPAREHFADDLPSAFPERFVPDP
jgi:hypothetical protein